MLRNETEVALRIFLQKFEGKNQDLFGAESPVKGFDEMVEFQECRIEYRSTKVSGARRSQILS